MEGVYKQTVTVEKIAFNDSIKKKLKAGEKAVNADVKLNEEGEFTSFRSVNNLQTAVKEGQSLITFADGSQKLLTEEDAKENLTVSKKKETAEDETAQVIVKTTDGTQTILDAETSADILKGDDSKSGKKK